MVPDAAHDFPRSDWLAPQPDATASALPAPLYADARADALDTRAVFARHWQLVAHADAVAGAGDHVVAALAGVPLLVVRDAGERGRGELRALHNVCRHRAGPLADCDGRGAQALTCRYHGWTYALDGRLRGAPEMGRADGFDAAAIRLPQARVAEWQGLVFAALDERAPPFDELVDGIEARLAAPLADMRFARRASWDIGCDWKVYVDNYLEGYHVPRVHPRLDALLDYRQYTTELARWHSLQRTPLDSSDALYGRGEALYWFVFPNTMLNVLPGRLQTNRVLPLGPGRCRVEFDFFYAPGAEANADADERFSDEVQREDIAICEAVQRNLASGSYFAGRLNPLRESGVWHFHELLRACYRASVQAGFETISQKT